MLRDLRSSVSSWTIKVLFTLLILSFVSFYGWSAGQGCNPHAAATVNGEAIALRDLETRFRGVVNQYRNMGLIKEDMSEEIENILRGSVLQGMINERLKVNAASDLGLVTSPEEVRDVIQKQFSDPSGKFEFDTYRKILAIRLHKTPTAYEAELADQILAQQFDSVLNDTTYISEVELKAAYTLQNEKVNFSYVEVDPTKPMKGKLKTSDPKDAEIEKYFKEHEVSYKNPEARKLEIAWVEEKDADSARSLLSDLKKDAQNKASLKEAAKDPRVHTLITGFVSQADETKEIVDQAQLIRASESLTKGNVGDPVRGYLSKNYYLIRLIDIKPATTLPFSSVKARVLADMTKESRTKSAREYTKDLLNRWTKAGKPLPRLAQESGFSIKDTGEFTRTTDRQIPGVGVSELGMSQAFTRTTENPFITEPIESKGKFYILALKKRTPPDWEKFNKDIPGLTSVAEKEEGRERVAMWTEHLRENAKIRDYMGQRKPESLPMPD